MDRRPTVLGALRKDMDVKLSAARMFESVKPWITAEERADAEKKVGAGILVSILICIFDEFVFGC